MGFGVYDSCYEISGCIVVILCYETLKWKTGIYGYYTVFWRRYYGPGYIVSGLLRFDSSFCSPKL